MIPLEFLIIFFESELRAIFKEYKEGSYDGLAGEIYHTAEVAVARGIAEVLGEDEETIAKMTEKIYDDYRALLVDPATIKDIYGDNEFEIIRDFSKLTADIIYKILADHGIKLNREDIRANAYAKLYAIPFENPIALERTYLLKLDVAIKVRRKEEIGDVRYNYTFAKVPSINGVEVIAIRREHLREPDCRVEDGGVVCDIEE